MKVNFRVPIAAIALLFGATLIKAETMLSYEEYEKKVDEMWSTVAHFTESDLDSLPAYLGKKQIEILDGFVSTLRAKKQTCIALKAELSTLQSVTPIDYTALRETNNKLKYWINKTSMLPPVSPPMDIDLVGSKWVISENQKEDLLKLFNTEDLDIFVALYEEYLTLRHFIENINN